LLGSKLSTTVKVWDLDYIDEKIHVVESHQLPADSLLPIENRWRHSTVYSTGHINCFSAHMNDLYLLKKLPLP
jgi:hypothetical protein